MNPWVSIVTPTYNRLSDLFVTIQSVKHQTYRNWEQIIVDDGSSDGTVPELERAAGDDPRIKVYRRKGSIKGPSNCRNEGVCHSSGKYVIFLDSDDILTPFCLEQRVRFMEDLPQMDFAAFPRILFREIPGDMGGETSKIFLSEEEDLNLILKEDCPWSVTGPIWKKEALKRVGDWNVDLHICEDPEYHARALLAGLRYQKINQPDWFCRVNTGRATLSAKAYDPAFIRMRKHYLIHLMDMVKRAGRLPGREKICASMFLREALRLARGRQKKEGAALWNVAGRQRDLRIGQLEKISGMILIAGQGFGVATKGLNRLFFYGSEKSYRHAIRPHKFREGGDYSSCPALEWAAQLPNVLPEDFHEKI